MRKDRDVRFRDVAPAAKISITQFNNSVDKLSGFPLESRIEPHRNRHFCVEVVKLGRNRSRCGQLNFLTISVGSIRIYSIAGQNLVKRKSINRSQCEYLEHTRYC